MNINFELDTSMPYFNTSAVKGVFSLQYPSGWASWQLHNESGQVLKVGNYNFSQEVLATWLENDDVLINDIKSAQPWSVIEPVAPSL